MTSEFRIFAMVKPRYWRGALLGLAAFCLADASALAAGPAPATQPAAEAAAPMTVRSADHGDFDRIVFDWAKPVSYALQAKDDRVTIIFGRSVPLDAAAIRKELPADVSLASAETAGASTTIVLKIPANATVKHFLEEKQRVVVDIHRAEAAKAEPAKPAAAAPAPAPGKMAATGTAPAATGTTPAATAAPMSGAAPTTLTPAANVQPPAVAGASTTKPTGPSAVYSISVPWDQPVGAAIFQRAGYLWMVFDRHQDVDIKLLRRLGGEAVTFAEQMPSKAVTILRLIVNPEFKPSVRRDGLLWVVDLTNETIEPSAPIDIEAPAKLASGTGIALDVKEPGNVMDFIDPEVGDTIVVVPVGVTGAGVYPGRDTPEVQLLTTLQGIAIVPHIDALDVKTSRSGVTIALLGGANMSLSAATNPAKAAMTATGSGLFDVSGWRGSGGDDFTKAEIEMEQSLVDLSPSLVGPSNLHAAQFYFANGRAAECLGYLKIAAAAAPDMVDTAPFRSLRGACSFLMGRYQEAQADLDNPLLKDDGEAQLWRAAAHAAPIMKPAEWNKPLAIGLPLIKNYPKALKWPLAEVIANAALADSDDATARDAIGIMAELAQRGDEKSEVDFLTASLEEMKGQFDRAIANYDHAKDGESREYRARAALAETELLLRTKKIKAKEAAERLDKLRFAWREGDFELNLLRRLADLQAEAEEYPEALRTLRTIVNNYSDNPVAPAVRQEMMQIFSKLYLDGAADQMQPVAAIGLYDEFRDLTPGGPQGDEMIRKLADRLVKVDLLDRAAALLKYQVTSRLKGLDKARVGSQLALLDLLDKRPEDAVDAINSSNVDGLPPELVEQRRHLLARALADVDRGNDALAALKDDTTREAGMLRAEIYWKQKDWTNAADAFAALVPEPDRGVKLDETQAQLVLNMATALTLAKDDRGLAALRRAYGGGMAGTSFAAAFELLTSAPDKQVTNFPGLADKIKQAQAFQTFIASYKEKVQSKGLSSIN